MTRARSTRSAQPGRTSSALEEVTHAWLEPVRERFSADYPYMLFEPTSGASGLGVISKYPLTASELQFVNNWHPAWRVEAQTPAGWLQLLIVHLRSNFTGRDDPVEAYVNVSDDHLLQTKNYVEHTVEDVPTVILGDFNESPEGSSVRYLEKIGYENVLRSTILASTPGVRPRSEISSTRPSITSSSTISSPR